ncbi:MAG: hypothetical protein OZSIB_3378 [Candidatus Ozemobacter sibiricus]|jgi:hypothetical protein|uniref:Prepilin-type N-terminal cleavage/methylation domain-containing protein n=1 Tax=Candidatus Ozemobacter sibiricus TaxID=2268124 RepID=A0A367ZQ69_9BACT|nr:MAG: hypothetical protein OZSIB_3378 [Candidatus Ozemobacter sibiricus]
MNGRRAITITELVIATGLLTLLLGGLFALYSGGQSASGTAFWMQKTATALRNTARHLSQKVQQSSYPSTLVYPSKIIENTSEDFRLRVNENGTLLATACLAVASKNEVATKLIWFVEALPERRGFDPEVPAQLTYHIYSLSRAGKILYHRFQETIAFTSPPDYMKGVPLPDIPPPTAALQEAQELIEDVELVRVGIQEAVATGTPVFLEIHCKYPRGYTRRGDTITVVPNVAAVKAKP